MLIVYLDLAPNAHRYLILNFIFSFPVIWYLILKSFKINIFQVSVISILFSSIIIFQYIDYQFYILSSIIIGQLSMTTY